MEVFLAHSAVSPDLIAAYRATEYRAEYGGEAVILRIDERSEPLSRLFDGSGVRCAAFITAYNPCSEPQNEEANLTAHAELGDELIRCAAHVIEGIGAAPSTAWPEEKSYLALGLDLESSRAIGREFKQNAIVWAGEDAIPRLILLR